MNRFERMTRAAASGTKGKLTAKAEGPLARRTPLTRDTIRTLAGAVFLFLSARTVVRALRAGLRG